MVSFNTKIKLIDDARRQYITFDNEFKNYIASGNSFNGAYNYFSLDDIEKHKQLSIKHAELEAWHTLHGGYKDSSPIKLSEHSILYKLEALNDSISKSSRD